MVDSTELDDNMPIVGYKTHSVGAFEMDLWLMSLATVSNALMGIIAIVWNVLPESDYIEF